MLNKKQLWYGGLLAVLLVTALSVSWWSASKETDQDKVEVFVQGRSIVYSGPLSVDGVAQVKNMTIAEIDRLIINSPGGEVNIGMDLGEWVFEHDWDVEVHKIAFSSAANYVFTAGKTKYLHRDSMVGWHGGITQQNDNFLLGLFMRSYLREGAAREKAFFAKIGVDQRSTVYGLRQEFDRYSEQQNYVGWTYSLAAMEDLGIKNIRLIDNQWAPASEYHGKKIFTIETIAPE